jgi:hypothetical protein
MRDKLLELLASAPSEMPKEPCPECEARYETPPTATLVVKEGGKRA